MLPWLVYAYFLSPWVLSAAFLLWDRFAPPPVDEYWLRQRWYLIGELDDHRGFRRFRRAEARKARALVRAARRS